MSCSWVLLHVKVKSFRLFIITAEHPFICTIKKRQFTQPGGSLIFYYKPWPGGFLEGKKNVPVSSLCI